MAAAVATRLNLRVTPYLAVESTMPLGHTVVILRDFEFSASHRLALPELNGADNLALFGKCSNPNGHGHNYRLRVAVSTGGDPAALAVDLDGLVEEEVLRHMDHKHLNDDTPYFRDRLPSVENIASTIHGLLAGPLSKTPLTLVGVRVWETDRTSAATCAGL